MSTDTPAQPLQKLASWQSAKYFWKQPFHKEELAQVIKGDEETWEIRLSNHRDKAILNLGSVIEKNELPSSLSNDIKASIFAYYQAYRQMLLWLKHYDQQDAINLLEEGDLYGPNYFTVEGVFNDVAWTKRFVLDPNYCINNRFDLACYYWLEDETAILWPEERKCGRFFSEEKYAYSLAVMSIRYHDPFPEALVLYKAIQLESKLCLGANQQMPDDVLFRLGMRVASLSGFEHAIYYFWQNLPESDKEIYIGDVLLYDMMIEFVDYPVDMVIHYFYSKMPRAQKEDLWDYTIEESKTDVWLTLLLSPCTRTRCEVLERVYRLPIGMYVNIIKSLIDRICRQKLPFHMDMFQVLWTELSPEQMNSVLEEPSIIHKLTDRKVYYIIGYIMKNLSLEQKAYFMFAEKLC